MRPLVGMRVQRLLWALAVCCALNGVESLQQSQPQQPTDSVVLAPGVEAKLKTTAALSKSDRDVQRKRRKYLLRWGAGTALGFTGGYAATKLYNLQKKYKGAQEEVETLRQRQERDLRALRDELEEKQASAASDFASQLDEASQMLHSFYDELDRMYDLISTTEDPRYVHDAEDATAEKVDQPSKLEEIDDASTDPNTERKDHHGKAEGEEKAVDDEGMSTKPPNQFDAIRKGLREYTDDIIQKFKVLVATKQSQHAALDAAEYARAHLQSDIADLRAKLDEKIQDHAAEKEKGLSRSAIHLRTSRERCELQRIAEVQAKQVQDLNNYLILYVLRLLHSDEIFIHL